MADEKLNSNTILFAIEKMEHGGYCVAVSNGVTPNRHSAACTTLEEVMRRIVHRKLEDTFKEAPVMMYALAREPYQPPNPPRMAQPGDETLEEVPRFMTSHPGHASGLVEQVKKMAANGGRASAFLFCAGIAFAAFVQRAGLV